MKQSVLIILCMLSMGSLFAQPNAILIHNHTSCWTSISFDYTPLSGGCTLTTSTKYSVPPNSSVTQIFSSTQRIERVLVTDLPVSFSATVYPSFALCLSGPYQASGNSACNSGTINVEVGGTPQMTLLEIFP